MGWLADKLMSLLFPNHAQAVLVAHNSHLAFDYANTTPLQLEPVTSMGYHLRALHGPAYVAIAQTALSVEFINVWSPTGRSVEAPEGDLVVEHMLDSAYDAELLLVVLDDALQQPFATGIWYTFAFDRMILRDQFSAFFYHRFSPGGESYAEDF